MTQLNQNFSKPFPFVFNCCHGNQVLNAVNDPEDREIGALLYFLPSLLYTLKLRLSLLYLLLRLIVSCLHRIVSFIP